LNNPVVTFNPGTILIKERQINDCIFLLLSGSVESIPLEHSGRSVLSAGAMIGELSGLFSTVATETYRAVGFVKALQIPCTLYGEFVRRNHVFAEIARVLENREFLQRTWLFGEVVSTKTLTRIAKEMVLASFASGETVETGPETVGLVARGKIGRFLGEHEVEILNPGDFFGEELAIFWTPSMFRLRADCDTDVFLIPATIVADIPSVRWKLFEQSGKRMTALVESEREGRELLRWHEEYRVDILRIDSQHRRLFEQSNAILDAIDGGRGMADVLAQLDTMAEYARYHFGEEEALMGRHAYAELENHRARHAGLMDQLSDLRASLEKAGTVSEDDLKAFLQDWLVQHILCEDRKYAAYLNARGVY
ncbi:MAG TPA: bacteriohemerythrin, partial [Candidatus Omnitrophota bacterium]|nr:bacteriohemerythrin [Candidatus Omnitrophota bacterium]